MGKRYPKPARELILEFVRKAGRPVTPGEIARGTGVNYNTVRGRLYELARMGLLKKSGRLVEVCESS